ncbi:Uncharacterised protein [Mycobacteroides abscessus subsp. abscessus]|nr:Uncharacterised protein [Mycobacteroides abscessus subsp. abscessus]
MPSRPRTSIGRRYECASKPVAHTRISNSCRTPSLVITPCGTTRSIPPVSTETLGRCTALKNGTDMTNRRHSGS